MKKLLFLIPILIFAVGCENGEIYAIDTNGERVVRDVFGMHETINCNNRQQITVTRIQERTNQDDRGVRSGEKLVAITFKIKNTTNSDRFVTASDFRVISSNGQVIRPLRGAITTMWEGTFFNDTTLVPDGEVEAYMVYQLAEDDNDFTIRVRCGTFWNNVEVNINPRQ